MELVHIFRSFEPLRNPIGFGGADFIELFVAAFLGAAALMWRPWIRPLARRAGRHPAWCAALLAIAPVVLRLALLAHHPVPSVNVPDEFGHMLTAGTLLHGRLANPPHPMHRFFETLYVLQEPTYSSIYSLGQGLVLAAGRLVSGLAWTGVLLAMAAFCGLCYWMLRGWTTPGWAMAGALIAIARFGPLNDWSNGYWGGHLAAAAGCLVFGALPRIEARARTRDAVLLGAGLGVHLLARPFESVFLLAGVIFYLAPDLRVSACRRALAIAAAAALPAVALTLAQNRAVTRSWTTLPYVLSRQQYGVPATFTFQPNAVPHRPLTPAQQADYRMQLSFHGPGVDTWPHFFNRLAYRVRFFRFFLAPPLYLAVLAFLFTVGERRYRALLFTLAVFFLGANVYPFFFPHYDGALAGLLTLAAVAGIERLSRIGPGGANAAGLLTLLALLPFAFWYPVHVFDREPFSRALQPFETWDGPNHPGDNRRADVAAMVARLPGRPLIFVRYSPQHVFHEEWAYNRAGIDAARVVWALDLGPSENEALRRYYPSRTAWLFEPDGGPPKLGPYVASPPAPPPAPVPAPPPPRGGLVLEQVPAKAK